MNLCTIAPHTMPQPHSHPAEEAWIMVKGETILSLGKKLRPHGPRAGLPDSAHRRDCAQQPQHGRRAGRDDLHGSGAARRTPPGPRAARPPAGAAGPADFARLDNSPINRATEPDVDMFMGNWRDAFPRIMHGNLYFRDMLTALQGPDSLHPHAQGRGARQRRGGQLRHARARLHGPPDRRRTEGRAADLRRELRHRSHHVGLDRRSSCRRTWPSSSRRGWISSSRPPATST